MKEIYQEHNNILFLIGEGFLTEKEVFKLNQYSKIYAAVRISWLAVKNQKK